MTEVNKLDNFLSEIFDQDEKEYFLRFMASCLANKPSENKLTFLEGPRSLGGATVEGVVSHACRHVSDDREA